MLLLFNIFIIKRENEKNLEDNNILGFGNYLHVVWFNDSWSLRKNSGSYRTWLFSSFIGLVCSFPDRRFALDFCGDSRKRYKKRIDLNRLIERVKIDKNG